MNLTAGVERHRAAVIIASAAAPLGICASLAAFRGELSIATEVLVVVLVVVAAASTGLRAAGFIAAISGGVWFDFFLTQPYQRLTINNPSEAEATVLLVVIGAAVTELALWGRRQQDRASRRSGYLTGVLSTAEIATLRKEQPDALVDHIAAQMQEVLGASGCRFVGGPVRDERLPLLDHQGLVTRQGRPIKVERDGLPTDDEIALPVTRAGVTLGTFLVTASARVVRPTLEQRQVAVLLADQAGLVLGDPAG